MSLIIVIIVCSVGKTLIDANYFDLSKVNKLSHKTHKFKEWLNKKILYWKLIGGHIDERFK